jgi:hypothetical protein
MKVMKAISKKGGEEEDNSELSYSLYSTLLLTLSFLG